MHVTLEDCGINWVPADGQRLFLDAAAGCLHTVEGRLVTSLQLPDGDRGTGEPGEAAARAAARGPLPSPQSSGSTTVRAGLVSAGPAVRTMLSSLDGSMTALRRGGRQLEIFDHATGNLFVEAPGAAEPGKTGRRDVDLLGFFWVQNEVGEPRLVMVTPLGLELYDLQVKRVGGWGLLGDVNVRHTTLGVSIFTSTRAASPKHHSSSHPSSSLSSSSSRAARACARR